MFTCSARSDSQTHFNCSISRGEQLAGTVPTGLFRFLVSIVTAITKCMPLVAQDFGSSPGPNVLLRQAAAEWVLISVEMA